MASLLLMAAIWGSTFFLIKDLTTRVPVTDMLALRFALAAVVLVLALRGRLRLTRTLLLRGGALGLVYGAAQLLQTFGLAHTSASISGFVTGLYVVMTPLLGWLLLRQRVDGLTVLAVLLATAGLGVLSLQGFTVSLGASLTLASAALYALHIVALGRWSTGPDALTLTTVQVAVVALVCAPPALVDGVQLPAGGADWANLLYLAVVAGALAMLLQTWAQSQVPATRAAVVMSMEPVFGALFAVALGGESFTWRLSVGGLSILAAMYLVELGPVLRRRRGPPDLPAGHPGEVLPEPLEPRGGTGAGGGS
ncbi:Threonine/homoserine efflux transporter RhtA [Auraticoccus monumenti]|uniref:Threonine/homoserine efflux transporter RhtA n=2 Tax=Auraticoccus monumenti TaxID=675864 RepID=A0A1G7DRB2_9ACTN|nr:Threonine/homoserine efflux transporter RhtA [Auraticoccus monumenti]